MKTLLDVDESMKENLSANLINELFEEPKKRQQNSLQSNPTSIVAVRNFKQKIDKEFNY